MKRLLTILTVVGLLGLLTTAVMADNVDTLTINYEVKAINELEITDDSVTLTVDSATAGAQPDQASDGTTYDITTNCATDAKKITGGIDTAMGTGLTLKVTAGAPMGGISAGAVDISNAITGTNDANLVTAIDAVVASGLALDFTLDATVAAGVVSSAQKTFTMTLTDSA